MQIMKYRNGFTLIELLVVITIIVVLLSLLAPALDKAIYQAELAQCGANMRGIGTGALQYAMENKRVYPHREEPWVPMDVRDQNIDNYMLNLFDPYVSRDAFVDPLCGEIDLRDSANRDATVLYSNLAVWIGYGSHGLETRMSPMRRVGQPMFFRDVSGTNPDPAQVERRFRVLASDLDSVGPGEEMLASHADRDGVLGFYGQQDKPNPFTLIPIAGDLTFSWWGVWGDNDRGPLDLNYAYDDGSVQRLNNVKIYDPRMTFAPMSPNPDERRRVQLPRGN